VGRTKEQDQPRTSPALPRPTLPTGTRQRAPARMGDAISGL